MKPTGENRTDPVSQLLREEEAAAQAFEARWTLSELKLVDAGLHEAVMAQRRLFSDALAEWVTHDIIIHGEAMCRGWRAAVDAMQRSSTAGDVALIGEFGEVVVAIGRSQTAPQYLIERYGNRLTYLRPREVAAMYMHYRQAQSVKAIWPDAEIIEVRKKSDAEVV